MAVHADTGEKGNASGAAVSGKHRKGTAVRRDQSLQVVRDPLLGAGRGGVHEGLLRTVEAVHRGTELFARFQLTMVDLVITDAPTQSAPGAGIAADDLVAQILRRYGWLGGHDPAIIGEDHRRKDFFN